MKISEKRTHQLGMSHGKANHKLMKDILFEFVKDKPCYRCGKPLTRETFSVEHKEPWLDSDDPVGNFFSLDNIDYSHFSCNVKAARRDHLIKPCPSVAHYRSGCRCEECKELVSKNNQKYNKKTYSKEKRRKQYLKYGT